jgi:hypothetical protein
VFYFIPELGESISSLNALRVPYSENGITLKDIKEWFHIEPVKRFRVLTKIAK